MKNRNFSLMVIGQVVSIFGSAILRFALDLYVLDVTGRTDIFAIVTAISFIPLAIFSPIGGAVADRFNRRNLMVIFDFCSGATVALLLAFFLSGNATIPVIAVAVTALSTIAALYTPSVQASIPLLVGKEKLAQANGIVNGVGALSGIIGPVTGSLLYGAIGVEALLAVGSAAFIASAIMEIFIQIPFTKPKRVKNIVLSIASDMKEGFIFMVRKNKLILRVVISAAMINFFMTSFLIIGATSVTKLVMGADDFFYGIAMASMQVAGIAGSLLVGIFAKRMKLQTLYKGLAACTLCVLPMALSVTPFMLGFGFLPSFILFVVFLMLIMLISTIMSVFVITEVQKQTPNHMLGKIMAIVIAVAQCAMPLGQLIYGYLFETFKDLPYVPALFAVLFSGIMAITGKRFLRE